jgi:rfaE bifunctional protein kinase chain/domain
MVLSTLQSDLLAAFRAIKTTPVLVVGDIILDRYIWGDVERVSAEAPVPVLEISRTQDRLGGAANVAMNLANLGAAVSLAGFLGKDTEAAIVRGLCESAAILTDGVVVDRNRPTTFKTRVIGRTQQLVRIDREERFLGEESVRGELASVIENKIEKAKCIILSDYAKGVVGKDILAKFQTAKEQGKLSLKDRPVMVDPHPANYELYKGMALAKPNRKEAERGSGVKITDVKSAVQAGKILLKRWDAEILVISLSEDGLVIVGAGAEDGIHIPTHAKEIFDVSGAGDTVTALFAAAIAVGATPLVAGTLANLGAGVVVSEVGTMPITAKQLEREINRIGAV